jgi:putative transposase
VEQLTKTVLKTALNQELTERLGHEKNGKPDAQTGNVRNGIGPRPS